MGLRFEAWSTPWDPGGFKRKVAMLPVIDNSGQGSVGFLALPGDSSADLSLANFDRLDDLVSDTAASLITVFDCLPDGTNTIIDEWVLNRVPSRLSEERQVSLSGPGLLSVFEKALVYAFDYPKSPAVQGDWIWGASDDAENTGLIRNGIFESSPMPNGGFEDGNVGSWQPTEEDGGLFSTSTIRAVFSPVDARTGDWYGQVIVNAQGDGIRRSLSNLIPGESYTLTGWINEPTGNGDRIRAGVDGASTATHTNAFEEEEIWWAELGNAAQGTGASTGVYQQVTLTFVPETDSVELVIIYDDINGLDFIIDDFSFTSGDNVGLDPWVGFANGGGLNPSPQMVLNTFQHDTTQSHGGSGSVRMQGVDDAFYDGFGRIGYGTIGMTQNISMVPGTLYTFTAWIRHNGAGSNGANERFRLVLARRTPKGPLQQTISGEFQPGPGSYYMANIDLVIPANTWTKIQLTTFADVSDIAAQVRYAGTNARNTDVGTFTSPTFWVDDVSIHEGLPATTIGDIWQKLLDDCTIHHQNDPRGTILDWVDYSSFDDALDSNGNAWNADITFSARWGSNMAHVLDDTFNRGYEAELVRKATPSGGKTHDFHLYNSGGRDDNPSAAIHTAQPLRGGDAVRRNPSATAALIASSEGGYTEDTDATALANFGRLETFISDSEASGAVSRQLLADNFFAFESANRNAVRFEVIEAPGVPRPFVDYAPGDTIPMTLAPTHLKEDRRVQRIDYLNTHPTQYVVVGSRLLEGEAAAFDLIGRMWRRMNRPAKMKEQVLTAGEGGGAGGAPTVVVAASDAHDIEKQKADLICIGTNDEQKILEAANLLHAFSSNRGGRILLSSGTFQCNPSVGGVFLGDNLIIQGMGRYETIVHTAQASGDFLLLGNDCTVQDLALTGTSATVPNSLLELDDSNVFIERVHFENAARAIRNFGNEISIRSCSSHFCPIFFDGSSGFDQVTIQGCIANTSGGGIGHIIIGNPSNNWLIAGNLLNGQIYTPGSTICEGISIVNNIWVGTGGSNAALITLSGMRGLVISHNNCPDAGGYDAIALTDPDGAIIEGNIFDNLTRGITIITADDEPVSIIGNHIGLGGNSNYLGEHGIVLQDSSLCQVKNNVIFSPGRDTDNTYDGVLVTGSGIQGNYIGANIILGAPSGNQPRSAVNIQEGTNHKVVGNAFGDEVDYGTSPLINLGTDTRLFYPEDTQYGDNFVDDSGSSSSPTIKSVGSTSENESAQTVAPT